jgi:monoamine oxidase
VQLNTPVQSISYGSDPVTITDNSGNTFEANKVIITVPVSVLKSGGISFSPSLPGSITTSLANIGMDASIRVILDFKKNFWGESTGFIWGGATGPQYFNAGAGRSADFKTLSITINGPKAADLSALGPDKMITSILAELDAIYAGQATLLVRRDLNTNQILPPIVQDWSKEEFIKGGYSFPLVSATNDDRKNMGTPVDNKLFFAGEASDVNGDAGTINGALASAERAAQEVIKSITGV